jgi:hypothetical protein
MTYKPTGPDSEYQPHLVEGLDFHHLNAFLPEVRGWRRIKARTAHEDLFGDEVRAGEEYYSRQAGMGFGDVLKLSQASMDRLLVAVFFANDGLRKIAAGETERRKAMLMEEMMSVVTDKGPGG